MKKRLIAVALAFFMLLSIASCSKGANTSSASGNAGNGPTANLTFAFMTFGNTPKDLAGVQNALNKITKKKINATVTLKPINVSSYSQQINLMLTSHEDLDLFVTGNLGNILQYSSQAPQGKLLNLDPYLDKYGSGITSALGKQYLQAGKVNGKTYGVITLRDEALNLLLYYDKNLAKKYNIDFNGINSSDDIFTNLEKVETGLKKFHSACPSVSPFGYTNGETFVDSFEFGKGDPLGDTSSKYGVLLDNQKLDVSDYYSSPEYKKMLDVSRRWFTEGIVDKASATSPQVVESLVKSGKVFSYAMSGKPGAIRQESTTCGKDMGTVELFKPRVTSQSATGFMLGIPSNTKSPEKSVQLLNLLYSDKDVVNLLCWGLEGKDYVKTGTDNVIDYPAGVTAANDGWGVNSGFEFGNQLLSYVWKGDDPNLWDEMKKYNDSGVVSKALGFSFNTDSIKTEYSALTNVTTQYRQSLENGVVEPDSTLPKFQSALKSAGLDKVITEKTKQLQDWEKTVK